MSEPKREPTRINIKLMVRVVSALVLFIVGFNFSNSYFFREFPLFGVRYLAEVIISVFSALVGFTLVPDLFVIARHWLEDLVIKTVTEIVSDFWDQQSRRMTEARRVKELKKAEDEANKLKEEFARGILLDTSVLIDGRILELAKTGFIDAPFIIIKKVMDELHLISDSSDKIKRQRGRKGLDTVNQLKKHSKILLPSTLLGEAEADKELIKYASQFKVRLMTLDFNLNKVARASGIKVLNLNELVEALKTLVLPGETLKTKILEAGKEKGQGVGYLSDGTMIVVQGAGDHIGQEIEAKVSKLIQTSAGKMIFCTFVAPSSVPANFS